MKHLIVAALVTGFLAVPAAAKDRLPNRAESQKIAATLKAAGYVSWEEVELDDDGPYWEVDDARKADRTRWDLRLDPRSYAIIRTERDD